MFNLDVITNENNVKHNLKEPYIPNHLYRILVNGASGSGKTNALLNLIREHNNDEHIDKIYLYVKNLNEPKYELLIKKREDVGIKHLKDPKVFIEYSITVDDVSNNIDDNNPKRNKKNLILFDDIIGDINANKKFQTIIKDLFFRCRTLNISLAFTTQEIRLNSTYYLIMKFLNKRELQHSAINHSADIMKI